MCMLVCLCVCERVYLCVHACMFTDMCICACVCCLWMSVSVRTCLYLCGVYAWVCVCAHARLYTCMGMCMGVRLCVYAHAFFLNPTSLPNGRELFSSDSPSLLPLVYGVLLKKKF